MRSGNRKRTTTETAVDIGLTLGNQPATNISTGIGMFDHLLTQWAFHARSELRISARSLDGIAHHLVEDVAIVLGEALDLALAERYGIARYGEATIAMDDALARAVVDFGGRPYSRTELALIAETIEGMATILLPHFFSSLAQKARIAIHIDVLAGTDPHHCIEAAFKAFARACRTACSIDGDVAGIASTKGLF